MMAHSFFHFLGALMLGAFISLVVTMVPMFVLAGCSAHRNTSVAAVQADSVSTALVRNSVSAEDFAGLRLSEHDLDLDDVVISYEMPRDSLPFVRAPTVRASVSVGHISMRARDSVVTVGRRSEADSVSAGYSAVSDMKSDAVTESGSDAFRPPSGLVLFLSLLSAVAVVAVFRHLHK